MKKRMLKNKIAIVTGASSGIGKAVALDLASQNYHLILIARHERRLKAACDCIKKQKGSAEYFLMDVSNSAEIVKIITKVIHHHKRIDLLFNSAGILLDGTKDISSNDLEALIQTNLLGAIYVAQAVAKQMKKQRSGYIINMASLAGKRSFPDLGGYSASKFGLVGFNDALFKEMLSYRVKVTAICPSVVNTPMTKEFDMDNCIKIQPRDIVKTVNYLLSLDFNSSIREIDMNCSAIVLDWE